MPSHRWKNELKTKGYVNELQHFIEVVRGQAKMSVTYAMTLAISKIAEAAEASARSGKPEAIKWTKDEIPDDYVMDV